MSGWQPRKIDNSLCICSWGCGFSRIDRCPLSFFTFHGILAPSTDYTVVSEFWCYLTLEVTCRLFKSSQSVESLVGPGWDFPTYLLSCLGIYLGIYAVPTQSMLCAQLVGVVDVGVPCSMSSCLGKPGPPLPPTLVRSTRRDVSLGGLGGLMIW